MGKKEYLKPLMCCLMLESADVITSSTDGLKSFNPAWLTVGDGFNSDVGGEVNG